jgi:hypothetical protein
MKPYLKLAVLEVRSGQQGRFHKDGKKLRYESKVLIKYKCYVFNMFLAGKLSVITLEDEAIGP